METNFTPLFYDYKLHTCYCYYESIYLHVKLHDFISIIRIKF